ncbi:MAG: ribosome maturation factor RimM [Bradymonadaceae bacterium]
MSEPELVPVGQFGRAHGIDGELRLFADALDSPIFEPGSRLYVESRDEPEPLVVEEVRPTPEFGIASFESVDDRNDAERYVNREVYVAADELPEVDEPEFYQYELEGSDVVAGRSDDPVGEVGGFFATGANDVMVVLTDADEEVFVPMVEGVIEEIDPEGECVRIAPPERWAPDGEDPFADGGD